MTDAVLSAAGVRLRDAHDLLCPSSVSECRARREHPRLLTRRRRQAIDKEVRERMADLLGADGPFGSEPTGDPIHGAQDGERQQLRITRPERALSDPLPDELSNAAI